MQLTCFWPLFYIIIYASEEIYRHQKRNQRRKYLEGADFAWQLASVRTSSFLHEMCVDTKNKTQCFQHTLCLHYRYRYLVEH